MEKTQYKKLSFNILMILLVIIPLATSFGVTTHYWDEKPLIMHPGQTKDVDVVLQNMVGDEDLTLQAEITGGSEIATLIDPVNEYMVPLGRKDIKVNIRVAIPENAALEDKYEIQVSFKQIAKEEGKMVQMTSSVGATIPILVKSIEDVPMEEEIPKEEEKISFTIIVILFLIILAIIIGYIFFKKRKKK